MDKLWYVFTLDLRKPQNYNLFQCSFYKKYIHSKCDKYFYTLKTKN